MRVRASFALLLAVTGCTTTYKVPKTELMRLDGWGAPGVRPREDSRLPPHREREDVRRLRDLEGRERLFTGDTPLVIVQRDGGLIAEKFIEVEVDDQRFRGVPEAAYRRIIELPLEEIESAGVREFSLGKTVVFSTTLALGLAATLFGMKLALGEPPRRPPADEPPCRDVGCEY
jgi:hypothetical protein